MYLALSVDVIKDIIANKKSDNTILSLYLVRYCSPNSVSNKYRQIASLDSSPYIKEDGERGRNNTLAGTSMGFR